MADSKGDEMSRQSFQVAYDGEIDTHSMDVQELAPALLGFGRLVRDANAELNGKRATVKVWSSPTSNINASISISK